MEGTRLFDLLDRFQGDRELKVALAGRSGGQWVTYSSSEYKKIATDFSCGLLRMGYRKGDRVAVVTNSRPEWNFIDMGMMQAGVIGVPVYTTISHDEYVYILNHAAPRMVIVSDKIQYNRLKPILDKVASIEAIYSFNEIPGIHNWKEIVELGASCDAETREELDRLKASITPDDICALIYTSGTTGLNKGVMLSHANILSNAIETAVRTDIEYGCKALSILPICHIFERMMNYHFQYNGVSVYYVENMGTIMPNIQEVKPNVFNAVPRILERIYWGIVSARKDLPFFKRCLFDRALAFAQRYDPERRYGCIDRMRYRFYSRKVYSHWREALGGNLSMIICGGAPLNEQMARVFAAMGLDMIEGYGLTETSPVIAVGCVKGQRLVRIGTVGQVLPSLEVKLLDDGEILCKGPSVMKGYYKDEAMTAESIDADGFFHTGDIGRFDADGYLTVTDRKKELFKLSNGKYVAPQVLENKLRASFYIDQVMAVGENEKFASVIISPDFRRLYEWCAQAHIQYETNEDLLVQPDVLALYQHEINDVNKTLGVTEQIKRFRLVPDEWNSMSGELSPTLKLRRKAIAAKYHALIEEIYEKKGRGGHK